MCPGRDETGLPPFPPAGEGGGNGDRPPGGPSESRDGKRCSRNKRPGRVSGWIQTASFSWKFASSSSSFLLFFSVYLNQGRVFWGPAERKTVKSAALLSASASSQVHLKGVGTQDGLFSTFYGRRAPC
jgi:hypothetical protein